MTKARELGIWKYNKRTGYWNLERTVTADTMDNWLHIFQKDEPAETFVISKNKPSKKPVSEAATLVREVWTNTIKKRDISDVGSFNSDDHSDGSKVIGNIKGYQIFHRYNDAGQNQFGIYNPKNKKTEGAVAGTIRKGIMKDIYAANKSGLKMDELYHWLLKNGHVKAFVANDQSLGAQKMWQKLASKKNITVHGWHGGKPINIDPDDEEETHTSPGRGRKLEPEEKMVGNTKLVATLSKRVNEEILLDAINEETLIVARKKENGNVQIGKRGWIHVDLLTNREQDTGDFDGEMGFVVYGDKSKKFMDREQALKYIKKNDKSNLKITKKLDDYGLHTNNIKDHNKIRESNIEEDAPAVSAGGGHVAGIGVGPKGEPGNPPRSLIKRTKFAGHEVFEVDNEVYHKARLGKAKHHRYAKYVGEDEVGQEIRQYGRDNPGKPIILKHNVNGALQFLKYGKY